MIHLSVTAAAEVNRRRSRHAQAHANPYANSSTVQVRFRLSVKPGGCSALYYTLALDEQTTDADRLLESNGVPIVVDAQSWIHLEGLTIDYSEDLMGGGFRFDNPNAAESCGCGNSFTPVAS